MDTGGANRNRNASARLKTGAVDEPCADRILHFNVRVTEAPRRRASAGALANVRQGVTCTCTETGISPNDDAVMVADPAATPEINGVGLAVVVPAEK